MDDRGLEHIKKLGIKAARNARQVLNNLSKKYGNREAMKILDEIYDSAEKDGVSVSYDIKNKNYDVAMIFSGCYDADIVRKACDWIFVNQDCFGDSILEVGCDCGFMTCFLGDLFPEKTITSIDRNESSINIAKKNAEKFGLKNVVFKKLELKDFDDERFDTVFSMRTIHENLATSNHEPSCRSINEITQYYYDGLNKYTGELERVLKDDGNLISIERLNVDPFLLAWFKSVSAHGLSILWDRIYSFEANELDDINYFKAMVSQKTNIKKEAFDSYSKWKELLNFDFHNNVLRGWAGQVYLEEHMDSTIDEFFVVNDEEVNDEEVGRFGIYTTNDKNTLFLYSYDGSERCLECIRKDQLDAAKALLEEIIRINEKAGFRIQRSH